MIIIFGFSPVPYAAKVIGFPNVPELLSTMFVVEKNVSPRLKRILSPG